MNSYGAYLYVLWDFFAQCGNSEAPQSFCHPYYVAFG